MTLFPGNTERVDPYKNFKFIVKFETVAVAGMSKVSGLTRTTETVEYREGGDPSIVHKSPGQTRYEPITLERGVTHDTAFEAWANRVWDFDSGLGSESFLGDFRKDITITLMNEAGQEVIQYSVKRCWVSEYQALPELDSMSNAVAIQRIRLENEGWERVSTFEVPAEFGLPAS